MQKSLFFFLNNTFFLTITSNFTAAICFPQVLFYWILISITENCHWNLEATSLVPSNQAAIVCINWWDKNLLADTLKFHFHGDGFRLNIGNIKVQLMAAVELSITWFSSAEFAQLPWNCRCWDFLIFWSTLRTTCHCWLKHVFIYSFIIIIISLLK